MLHIFSGKAADEITRGEIRGKKTGLHSMKSWTGKWQEPIM